MDEPQVVRLSPSEPMKSLYRDVLAPLSDVLRLTARLRQQRSAISSEEWQYKRVQKISSDFTADFKKLTQQLDELRSEITRILSAETLRLRSERANLEAVRQKFKSAKNLDERIALAMDGPYAAKLFKMRQQLNILMGEKVEIDGAAPGEDTEKHRHALSSSIGRLKSQLGTLATMPASKAADRMNTIDRELQRIAAGALLRPQREREGDIARRLNKINSNYENARKVVDAYPGPELDAARKQVANIEEQLRRHGFSDPPLDEYDYQIHAFDVVKVLNSTGAIGYSRLDEKWGATRPVPLSAAPEKTLLLFIHGLGGDREATWGAFPSLLMSDKSFSNRYAIDFYTYPTTLFRLPFFPRAPKIQVLADGLRAQIKYAGHERVSLVCHSLGGLIAKHYLIEELEANRALWVDRVVFLAVPNNGSDLAAVGALLSWRHHQLRQLRKDADIIEFSNRAWRRHNMRNNVRLKYIVGSQDRVVDRLSAEEYWGNPDVETVLGSGHIDIVKPNHSDDMVVKIVKHFLLS
jgi:pimeloyl-ACP methyl ester carboxylesterase